MTMDLSILIPARNEMFLGRTIQDIIEHAESDYEIIAVLDGQWADPPIPQHERVTLVYHPESIGQRAATNEAARLATGKYLMKVDAHCAFDQGFDRKMIADMQDDWTVVPVMRNLHVFNWKCMNCGMETYQGAMPTTCTNKLCSPEEQKFEMQVVWISKTNPQSSAYRFNTNLRFKYFPELRKRQPKTGMSETMSLQGSCFIITQEKYFELDICDETWGSWGQQGSEVALKTWLSGGQVMCNMDTWYAHMFRTQPGFGHPYPDPSKSQQNAIKENKKLFMSGKWDKAVHPLSWLLDKFWLSLEEVEDQEAKWTEEELQFQIKREQQAGWGDDYLIKPKLSWGVLYYTDNCLNPEIMEKCQKQLKKCIGQHKLVSVSLKSIDFGNNIVLDLERGYLTLFKQILAGLEKLDTDIVFFAEHDILYHPSHFWFIPTEKDKFHYNINVWKVRMSDGHGLHYDCQQLSGLCANRELLLKHYRKRIEMVEKNGYTRGMGFEPGTHGREKRVDDYKAESWKSEWPIIDLRHDTNLTQSRWTKEEFRNQKFTEGWEEKDNIPGWGHLWHFWKKIKVI